MRYQIIPVTPFQQNCSLLWCEVTRKAVLIDPGGEIERLLDVVIQAGVELDRVILTHGHIDHVAGAAGIAQRTGVEITGPHRDDGYLFEALPRQAEMFGFPHADPFLPDRWLSDGEQLALGEGCLEVIHTPGHTPGHIVLYLEAGQLLFVGDVLFRRSIGRTDLPRGDHAALLRSIRERLFPLGDGVTVVPGHGPLTTIGEERESNPYVGIGR